MHKWNKKLITIITKTFKAYSVHKAKILQQIEEHGYETKYCLESMVITTINPSSTQIDLQVTWH
jgi:hypothetical protein